MAGGLVSCHRSSAADLRRRIDAAALLLADGLPRTAAVTQLAERYRVDRRTARRDEILARVVKEHDGLLRRLSEA